MKHLFFTFLVAVLTLGIGMPEAEAKRLGGGSSFGMQRKATPQAAPTQPAATQQAPRAGAAGAAAPKRNWLGPIAGLAAGLGLAALFSHLGLGEELASFVMLALLVFGGFMLFRMLFRRGSTPARDGQGLQYAGAGPTGAGSVPPQQAQAPLPGSSAAPPSVSAAVASGFDAEGFARQAKVNFIRLQAANDTGNLDDIREFTTPEMFAEIRMQLTERGAVEQRTDVVELNADVVEVAEEDKRYIVSVRFTGLLREEADAAPASFDEIWHLTKPIDGSGGWLVAGIQQTA